MKLRTALISIVVSAALIGGAGYGAYYVTQSRKSPVEVVPVSNVNMSYYGFNQQETIYGSVTSQIAQTVSLNEEYGIDKIFVKEGDKVKEGTPLFSYDMTLQELELEMQQLDLQTNQLTMTRLEKELEKLKKTPASASLVRDLLTLTASAEETAGEVDEVVPDDVPQEGTGPETNGMDGSGQQEAAPETDGIQVEGVEKVDGEDPELSPVMKSVLSFENLALGIQATFLACGDELKAEDVGEAIEEAVSYYRKNLAEEKITEELQEDGSQRQIREYVLSDAVREAIDETELELLTERCKVLDECQVSYVEMLISEAEALEVSALPEAVEKIQKAYDLLPTRQQDEVENLSAFEDLKALAGDVPAEQEETSEESESGQPQESDSQEETEQGTESVTGEELNSRTGDGGDTLPSGDDTESQTSGTGDADTQASQSESAEGQTQPDADANGQPATEIYDQTAADTNGQQADVSQEETAQEPVQNTVTFDVGEGVSVMVDGRDVTNSFAMAEDGRIVFSLQPETGYEVARIQVNGAEPARENETGETWGEYVVEGIKTNDAIVSVQTQQMTQSAGTPVEALAQGSPYTVTINPGNLKKEPNPKPGDTVPLQADLSNVTLVFTGWNVAPASGQADQKVELDDEDIDKGYACFTMPEFDVIATARYQDAPDAINSYTDTFLANAEQLLAENAEQLYTDQGKDFLTELEGAIAFYQRWLSNIADEVMDDTPDEGQEMEKYMLLENVGSYLTSQGREAQVLQLQEDYKRLCLLYVRTLFVKLDPAALDKELLTKAGTAYRLLGETWRGELEENWKNEQAALAEQAGQPWGTDENGEKIPPEGFLSIGDTLGVYNVQQMFQEYLQLPPETSEVDRYTALWNIWSRYLELSDAQKAAVASDPFFVETMRQFGLWEDEEPQTEFPDYGGGYDDFGGDFGGDEPLYTADELQEMIRDKEQEIKDCALDIRQSELDLRQKQRVVDGKIVKSTMEGTVVSIGGADGESEEDYFVKVASEAGLYAEGSMNELALEKINVGDTISGMLQTNGTRFTAVIKEVSEYPSSGDNYSYGENSNASYYPFYALIDDTEDLEEGSAEIYLTPTAPGQEGGIYLQNYFIRSEPDGRNYVFKEGGDGKLTKQYVTTGKNMDGYALEIVEGLEITDSIAFPYGKNVVEGAKTKEVDMLQDAYM